MSDVSIDVRSDPDFEALRVACVDYYFEHHDQQLFTTDVDKDELYKLYLDNLPSQHRQHHTCSCCRDFINRYGHLVTIDQLGMTRAAFWPPLTYAFPEVYNDALLAIRHRVMRAKVTGVFRSSQLTYGTLESGGYHHFGVIASRKLVYNKHQRLTAGQQMALDKENYRTLSTGLAEFPLEVVKNALNIIESDTLFRSEVVRDPIKFLFDLHTLLADKGGDIRRNLLWRAVASAPVGFCTPRSSMAGTLLWDIKEGNLSFDEIKRRFTDKMHPLQYRRPQAAPTAGAIAAAEKLFEQLELGPSLRRRFARLEEIPLIWTPAAVPEPQEPERGKLFAHLQPKTVKPDPKVDITATTKMSFVKFARDVLPKALSIKVWVENRQPLNFCGLVTAVDPDAKPILQWDRPDARNPVSWYVYHMGSFPDQWSLPHAKWVKVNGICELPPMWKENPHMERFGKSAILIMDGCRDVRSHSLSIFPETLIADLHPVRSVIEAYSKNGRLEGEEEASANGLRVGDGTNTFPHRIRVHTQLGAALYMIDRWE